MKMRSFRTKQSGSFIIEALISLVLFSVGIISLMGLSIQALNQTGQSKARNDASYVSGELIAEMWVRSAVDIGGQTTEDCTTSTSWTCRVKSQIPTATPKVYFSSCTCDAATLACSGAPAAQTGNSVTVVNQSPVTVCVFWTDRKEDTGSPPHMFQTSGMITHN